MAIDKIVGHIPDFTTDETVERGTIEEVKEAPAEEVEVEEKETPAEPPAESSEEEPKPALETESVDTGLAKQVQGLQDEREKLLTEIQTLRGSRRELKQQEVVKIDQKIQQTADELTDLHPEDVNLIDRVLRSKGYITKADSSQMFYDAVKNEEVTKFLNQFPEYKPENDSNDLNWSALERQIKTWYRMPDDPHSIGELLLKAHRDIAKTPSDRGATTVEIKKQQVKIASSGSSGIQRSSSAKSLSPAQREHYVSGGWSEEEIKKIEKNLPE